MDSADVAGCTVAVAEDAAFVEAGMPTAISPSTSVNRCCSPRSRSACSCTSCLSCCTSDSSAAFAAGGVPGLVPGLAVSLGFFSGEGLLFSLDRAQGPIASLRHATDQSVVLNLGARDIEDELFSGACDARNPYTGGNPLNLCQPVDTRPTCGHRRPGVSGAIASRGGANQNHLKAEGASMWDRKGHGENEDQSAQAQEYRVLSARSLTAVV